ncbi:MAG: hypothetical protein A3F40_01085 [Chlamydiae bacterium RIFCSPHIGHO2_12_FULL_27_8]|nr:MAG: hypothetical protein A3F40_01085 [Chlamydiae bacterium RIFCSPHIGHO2_12_FULL_27_8]
MSNFLIFLEKLKESKNFEDKYFKILKELFLEYKNESKISENEIDELFITLTKLMIDQIKNPFKFDDYHKKIESPFNYYEFGKNFIRPLIDKNSQIYGIENLEKIQNYIDQNENVILLSNHQSECDPEAIFILLEEKFNKLQKNIIFVAGERVISDPLAVPFSKGVDLLCIYSKRYLDIDLEKKHEKQLHNKRVMTKMSSLLSEGGKIIYVAPSGGRDRIENGNISIADFDPQSIEMIYLMAKKSKIKTHFILLTLFTYYLLPPPESIQIEIGEKRSVKKSKIFLSFSDEIDMENFPEKSNDRIENRVKRAKYLHGIVKNEFLNKTKRV